MAACSFGKSRPGGVRHPGEGTGWFVTETGAQTRKRTFSETNGRREAGPSPRPDKEAGRSVHGRVWRHGSSMVVPGRVEVVSHKTRPFGMYRRTTCSPLSRVQPDPRTLVACSVGKPQPDGDRCPGEGPGWVRVGLGGEFLREAAAGWRPASGRRPGLGTIRQPPPPSLFPVRCPPVDRMWSYTGFPHPPGPCQCPRLVLSVRRQSALLISQATRQPYRVPVQIPSKIRRCKYGYVLHFAIHALLACIGWSCLNLVHTHLPFRGLWNHEGGAWLSRDGKAARVG